MSADVLRQAAALMRERANDATASDWHRINEQEVVRVEDGEQVAETWMDEDAAHIASWDPAVALAVADWLEVQADEGWTGESLAVARAYLGESA